MTGLAPGYRRQRFAVSISYPADWYDGPFTTDEIAIVLIRSLDDAVAVTVTTDAADDEDGPADRPGWSLRDAEMESQ
jgi:hypothetical protein